MVDGLSSMKEVKKGFALRSDEEVRRAELYHLQHVRAKTGEGFTREACCFLRQSLLQAQAELQLAR